MRIRKSVSHHKNHLSFSNIRQYVDNSEYFFSFMIKVYSLISQVFIFLQVTTYLLDPCRMLDDDETYRASLEIEPRQPRMSIAPQNNAI